MKHRAVSSVDTPTVNQLLGDVAVPGSLDEFVQAMQKPWGNIIRRRRDVPPEDLPMTTVPIDWYSLGHRPTTSEPKPSRTVAYAAADYFVQDAGSLLALAVMQADSAALEGKWICDLCAAPGGKASALVEAIDDGNADRPGGFVLANEVIRSRLGALQLNLARTGSDRYAISSLDPEVLAERLPGTFDFVLVDAPCSGQALVSRGKQKLSSFSVRQVEHCAARQHRILDAAVRLLRDGGSLIYSTCTFAEAENEAQVQRLITRGIALADPLEHLGEYASGESCYRLWPHIHQCAGSFAARLRIVEATNKEQGSQHVVQDLKVPEQWQSWFGDAPVPRRLWQNNSVLIGWPQDAPPWVESVAASGPELAYRTGQTWKPAHAAALRRVRRCQPIHRVELEADLVRRYLRGETIPVDADGWQVACYRGRPLGWIKGTGGVGKNHLPSPARFTGDLAT